MAKFKEGQSGNPNGRPKGSENKATGELRQVISDVLKSELTPVKLRKMLRGMKDPDRLNFMVRLMDFVLPKLKQQSVDVSFEDLSEDVLNQVFQKIFETNGHEGDN